MNIATFNDLYSQFYKRSFLFTKSYVRNTIVAEDIASESLIKLWEINKSKDIENPKAFLLKILKNKALDYLKHELTKFKAHNLISDLKINELNIRISTLQACNPEEIFSKEVNGLINEALKKLPEQTRKVFMMSRFENYSNKEIAKKLNISVKGIEYHITKSLKIMKIYLKDYLPLLYFITYFQIKYLIL